MPPREAQDSKNSLPHLSLFFWLQKKRRYGIYNKGASPSPPPFTIYRIRELEEPQRYVIILTFLFLAHRRPQMGLPMPKQWSLCSH